MNSTKNDFADIHRHPRVEPAEMIVQTSSSRIERIVFCGRCPLTVSGIEEERISVCKHEDLLDFLEKPSGV